MEWFDANGERASKQGDERYSVTTITNTSYNHLDHHSDSTLSIHHRNWENSQCAAKVWHFKRTKEEKKEHRRRRWHSIRFICSPSLITYWPVRAWFYIFEIRMEQWDRMRATSHNWHERFVYTLALISWLISVRCWANWMEIIVHLNSTHSIAHPSDPIWFQSNFAIIDLLSWMHLITTNIESYPIYLFKQNWCWNVEITRENALRARKRFQSDYLAVYLYNNIIVLIFKCFKYRLSQVKYSFRALIYIFRKCLCDAMLWCDSVKSYLLQHLSESHETNYNLCKCSTFKQIRLFHLNLHSQHYSHEYSPVDFSFSFF